MPRHDAIIDTVQRHYNAALFEYETRRLHGESPVEYAMTLRYLDRWIAAGSVVADIGVGVGHYARHLAQRQCRLHLVDIAERLLQAATEQLAAAGFKQQIIGVTTASATDLQALSDHAFDAVLMLGPLYHLCDLEDRRRAVREAHRLLKPGGVLFAAGIIGFPAIPDLQVKRLQLFSCDPPRCCKTGYLLSHVEYPCGHRESY